MRTNLGLETVERELQDALNHLYDPTYQPARTLRNVLSGTAPTGSENEQSRLIRAIEAWTPAPDTPSTARSRRISDVLVCRYIQKLTQDETADRLGITARHLRREQAQAIHALAQKLWEDYRARTSAEGSVGDASAPFEEDTAAAESPEWLSQVRQEVSVLERGAMSNLADVSDTIARVVELMAAVASKKNVALKAREISAGLTVAVHSAELRQVLVHSVSELVHNMSAGQVELAAEKTADSVAITITASPVSFVRSPEDDLVRELLSIHGGSITSTKRDDTFSFYIALPLAASFRVLVVDDNPDLVHFYQRYAQGTRYQIIPLREGARAFEVIQTIAPDIIVLDVMLPDADGWELLSHLRNHPVTRTIPVIVCSVVREEELALALGAALYVPKPVRRQDFIQALDRALDRAEAKLPPASANNATTG